MEPLPPIVPPIVPKVPESSAADLTFVRRVARSGMWNTLGFLGASASAFAVSIVVARTTDASGLGRFTYYTWLMRLVGILAAFGLPAALARFIPEAIGAEDPQRARGTWRLGSRLATILGLIAFAVMFILARSRGESVSLALAVGVGSASTLAVKLLEGFLQGALKFKQIARMAAIIGSIQISVIVAGAALGADATGLLILFALTPTLFAVLLYLPIRSPLKSWPPGSLDRAHRRKILSFAATLGLVAFIDEVVWGRPEIFFLEHFRSAAEVGFYSVGLKFASLVVVLPAVISKSLLPEFSWMHGAKRTQEFEETFPVLCVTIAYVAVGLAILGAAMADLLVTVVFSPEFSPAIIGTQVLLAGSVFGGLAGPVAAALFAGSKEKFFVQFGLLLVTINLVLDFALIPRYGLLGASIATIASQTIGAGIGYFLTVKRANLPYPTVAVIRLILMAVIAGAAGRAVATLLEGVLALVTGGAVAAALYVFLADRSNLVTVSQLRGISRRSPAPVDP